MRKTRVCLIGFVFAGLLALPALAQTPGKSAAKDEVTTFKRAPDPKAEAAKVDDKKSPGPGAPEQRRTKENKTIQDIEDELAILGELLDIERGSDTEADTLLELSYVLWDRAEAYEIDAHDEELEVAISRCEANGDKAECRRLKVTQDQWLEKSRAAKLDVINHLKRIERNFPRYANLDEVLYSLGFHLAEIDRAGESVDAYMRLVRKTPKSKFLPDAYLGIGNYYYGKNQGDEALRWYNKVIEFPDASVYGWGLYYISWVYYNQQKWETAVNKFLRVLDYSKKEANGRVTFTEDATKYLVKSWAEYGNPKNANAFFHKVAEGSEVLLMEALARHYIDVSEFTKSNIVLDDLIDIAKSDKRLITFMVLRLDNSYKLHDLDATVFSATMVGNALRQGAEPPAKLELLMAEIASTLHSEYENTLNMPTLESAEKIYRVYSEHFSGGEHGYDMLYNHALALFQLADKASRDTEKARKGNQTAQAAALQARANEYWELSAGAYEKVIDKDVNGKYAEAAAHRAFIAYYKLERLNAEVASKSLDDADLRPVALNSKEQRVASACERYISIALKHNSTEDVPEALFVAGRLWYQHNFFQKSGDLLATLLERYPEHELACDAARLALSSFNLNQDGKKLIYWTDKLLAGKCNTGKLSVTLTEIKANEEYNKCIERKDQPVQAAQCLVKYQQTFPDAVSAPRALIGAAKFYRQAKREDDEIATYQAFAKAYPKDERAGQSAFEIGEIYRESGAYEDAAAAYEAFVKAYPDHKAVAEALDKSQAIHESLGAYDKVVESGELFLARCVKDAKNKGCDDASRADVAYKLTVQYQQKGDYKGVIHASEKFLKRGLNVPDHLAFAAMVNTGAAQYKLGQGDRGKKLFDEVLARAKALADANKMAALDPIGKDAVAQAVFMLGELEFDKVKAIKTKAKDVKAAADLVATKAKAATVADGFYIQVEDSKNPRWVAAAASRRGRIHQDIATSITELPAPPQFAKSEELKSEWASQLAEKAAPQKVIATERYREALKKAAEVYAFDNYWAEARDNLKTLDTKFAEISDIKELTVELTPYKWTDAQKPADAIAASRSKLYELGADAENAKASIAVEPAAGDVVADAAPAGPSPLAQAYEKMALAHHALGQERNAILVGAVGMAKAPELKNSATLQNALGLAHLQLGETQKALERFQKAAEVDPKATEPLLNAASVTVKNLGFEKTVTLLTEVTSRDPYNYWARITLPVATRRVTDDREKIKASLQTDFDSIAGDPANEPRPEWRYNRCVIAQAVLTQGKKELNSALGYCDDALKNPPKGLQKELQKRVDGLKATIEFAQ